MAGFLIGRGFSTTLARRYASGCVIRVTFGNDSGKSAVSYDLHSWHVRLGDGDVAPPTTREDWMPQWRAAGLPDASLMGFEWSQLPTRLELGRGDTAQGMVHTGLPAGSRFDLLMQWTAGGQAHRVTLKGIPCAPASP